MVNGTTTAIKLLGTWNRAAQNGHRHPSTHRSTQWPADRGVPVNPTCVPVRPPARLAFQGETKQWMESGGRQFHPHRSFHPSRHSGSADNWLTSDRLLTYIIASTVTTPFLSPCLTSFSWNNTPIQPMFTYVCITPRAMAWSPRRPAMLLPSWRLPSAQPYSTPYRILRVSLVRRSSATSACVLSSRMSVFQLQWHCRFLEL